jgi:MoaA/NifB/PqqE/SkfB family radical SAM enzyme
MTSALFRQICEEVAAWPEKPGCIYLNMDGEPLMDTLFEERLSVLSELGLAPLVYIQTNGQFLNASKAKAILKSGIGEIYLGLDGATKATYEAMRVRCDFDRVINNLKRFASLRAKMGAKTAVRLKYVRTKVNDAEVKACYDMVSEFLDPDLDSFHDTISVDWANDQLASKDMIFNKISGVNNQMRRTGGCPSLESLLVVYADGRIPACCWDYNLQVRDGKDFGNAKSTPLLDIWHGVELQKLRTTLKNGKGPKKCESCIMMYEQPAEEMPPARIDSADHISVSPGYGYIYSFEQRAAGTSILEAEPSLWKRLIGRMS